MARAIDGRSYEFCFESFITSHPVYKEIWSPVLNELLVCEGEPENSDKNAVN